MVVGIDFFKNPFSICTAYFKDVFQFIHNIKLPECDFNSGEEFFVDTDE